MRFVALLRGINVGGNVIVKMSDLKTTFEDAGFKNVQTLLASGNIIFDSNSSDTKQLEKKIEGLLEKRYGRRIRSIVIRIEDIGELEKSNPFRGISVTKETRLNVTFLREKPSKHLETTDKFFRIVQTSPIAVCSVLTLTPNRGTVDVMGSLEKHYGDDITTRSWNTVLKILKAAI
jgi:uncharacterized protein (DUF1697 family)